MTRLMLDYKDVGWWYWLATVILLSAGLFHHERFFLLAIGLTVIQLVHFRLRFKRITAFPVQVRIGYTLLLLIAVMPGMNALFWVPTIGTWAQVLVGYCAMARLVSLLPWYRSQRLSIKYIINVFMSPPVRGSVIERSGFT